MMTILARCTVGPASVAVDQSVKINNSSMRGTLRQCAKRLRQSARCLRFISAMAAITKAQRETLRRLYQPARIQLLFIGESPPASGRFFYSGNSGLYRAMRIAFEAADHRIDDDNFLAAFKARGCYLTDLSHDPVDRLDPHLRRLRCAAGEKYLAQRIRKLQPLKIAPVLRSIAQNVANAAARAEWNGPILQFPYPGRWSRHREAFIHALVPVIRGLKNTES